MRASRIPEKNFLIGPDHRQEGGAFSLYSHGQWDTPLGMIPVDEDLARRGQDSVLLYTWLMGQNVTLFLSIRSNPDLLSAVSHDF